MDFIVADQWFLNNFVEGKSQLGTFIFGGWDFYMSDLREDEVSRVIEMAWEDRTPFEAIKQSFGLSEANVIKLMRKEVRVSAFKTWRKRVAGRNTKHVMRRSSSVERCYCSTQYKIRSNK